MGMGMGMGMGMRSLSRPDRKISRSTQGKSMRPGLLQ